MCLLFSRSLRGLAEGVVIRRTLRSFFAHRFSAAFLDAFFLRLDIRVESGFV